MNLKADLRAHIIAVLPHDGQRTHLLCKNSPSCP